MPDDDKDMMYRNASLRMRMYLDPMLAVLIVAQLRRQYGILHDPSYVRNVSISLGALGRAREEPRTCVKPSALSRLSNCCTSPKPPSATPYCRYSVATPASATQV